MNQNDYVRTVLAAYQQTPTTAGHVRRSDRLFAAELYQRGVPLAVVENALVLGASRRLYRNLDAPPLTPIQSLHYFRNLIDEVTTLQLKHPQAYFNYLRHAIETFEQRKQAFLQSRQSKQA